MRRWDVIGGAVGLRLVPVLLFGCGLLSLSACGRTGGQDADSGSGVGTSGVPLRISAGVPLETQAKREFRAVWIATVANIDWPSAPGLPVGQQQRELLELLDLARTARLNAVIFQVRPAGDALYKSRTEPWSEWLTGAQGRPPETDWDPLAFAVAEAHRRGLELHAWFNPYRARHKGAKTALDSRHLGKRRPATMIRYGKSRWFDPGSEIVQDHVRDEIVDVVRRYDIDGVHLDDYFYPYPEPKLSFDDGTSYSRYRNAGGQMPKSDFRRASVNRFVRDLRDGIHRAKPWVRFGISPFGIARPGIPAGIKAGVDQYEDLAADVQTWLRSGWLDYVTPQLYWPIKQTAQSYPKLLGWWSSVTPRNTHLWIGNFATKAWQQARGWSLSELIEQVRLTQADRRATGTVLFSAKTLRTQSFREGLRDAVFPDLALVPASPWLDGEPAPEPELNVSRDASGLAIRWKCDPDARFCAVYVETANGHRLVDLRDAQRAGVHIPSDMLDRWLARAIAISTIDRAGNESRLRAVRL